MNILDLPPSDTDKEIAKKERIIKQLENDIQEFKQLPEDLTAKGWVLKKNKILIPFTEKDKIQYYFSIMASNNIKNNIAYSYTFETKDKDTKEYYALCQTIIKEKFIDIQDNNINRELENNRKALNISKKGYIQTFLIELIPDIKKHKIQDILNNNYQIFLESLETTEPEPEKFKYKTFEDYPDFIKKEAIKIIETDSFFNELLDSISWKHEGDKKEAKLLLLSYASIYIKEPVHQLLRELAGTGKSNIFNRTKELQPEQYIIDLVSFSVKSLYYGKDFILNDLYNILIIDDVKFTNDIIELLKLLLDNERKKKIHRTVIDGKYKEMELEGYFLGLINRAKDDIDIELADRCYNSSFKDNDKGKIKNKIKQKNFRDMDLLHENKNLILRACYQYIINKNIKVYNPYLLFFNINDHENRNINHYMGFIKAMSFYNYNQRKTINNTLIGSYKDMDTVLNIISDDFTIQKDKLTPVQTKILDELDNNPENNTYIGLGGALGYSNEWIRQAIQDNKESNQLGLISLGYLKQKDKEDSYNTFEKLRFKKIKDYKEVKEENSLTSLPSFNTCKEKNPLLLKQSIILNFLEYQVILINEGIYTYIKNELKKEDSYSIESYENVCIMLENIYNKIIKLKDLKHIGKDNISSKELSYHNEILIDILSD